MTPKEKSRAASAVLGASIGFAAGALIVWRVYYEATSLTPQVLAVAALGGAVCAILGAILGAVIG